jgi:hypothetical protein
MRLSVLFTLPNRLQQLLASLDRTAELEQLDSPVAPGGWQLLPAPWSTVDDWCWAVVSAVSLSAADEGQSWGELGTDNRGSVSPTPAPHYRSLLPKKTRILTKNYMYSNFPHITIFKMKIRPLSHLLVVQNPDYRCITSRISKIDQTKTLLCSIRLKT